MKRRHEVVVFAPPPVHIAIKGGRPRVSEGEGERVLVGQLLLLAGLGDEAGEGGSMRL